MIWIDGLPEVCETNYHNIWDEWRQPELSKLELAAFFVRTVTTASRLRQQLRLRIVATTAQRLQLRSLLPMLLIVCVFHRTDNFPNQFTWNISKHFAHAQTHRVLHTTSSHPRNVNTAHKAPIRCAWVENIEKVRVRPMCPSHALHTHSLSVYLGVSLAGIILFTLQTRCLLVAVVFASCPVFVILFHAFGAP